MNDDFLMTPHSPEADPPFWPPYPEETERMKLTHDFAKLDLGLDDSFLVFLERACIPTQGKIRSVVKMTGPFIVEVYRIFTIRYFIHLSRHLRFDHKESGGLMTDTEILQRMRFPEPRRIYRLLAVKGYESARSAATDYYPTIHFKTPQILTLRENEAETERLMALLNEMDRIQTADDALALWSLDQLKLFAMEQDIAFKQRWGTFAPIFKPTESPQSNPPALYSMPAPLYWFASPFQPFPPPGYLPVGPVEPGSWAKIYMRRP